MRYYSYMGSNTKHGIVVAGAVSMLMLTAGAVGAKIGGGYSGNWLSVFYPVLVPATIWGLLDGSRRLWHVLVPKRVSIGRPWAEVYRRATPPSVSILNYTLDDDDHSQ